MYLFASRNIKTNFATPCVGDNTRIKPVGGGVLDKKNRQINVYDCVIKSEIIYTPMLMFMLMLKGVFK